LSLSMKKGFSSLFCALAKNEQNTRESSKYFIM
jgi:hypothetical protein